MLSPAALTQRQLLLCTFPAAVVPLLVLKGPKTASRSHDSLSRAAASCASSTNRVPAKARPAEVSAGALAEAATPSSIGTTAHSQAGPQRQRVTAAASGMGKASTALSKRLHAFVSGGVQGVFFRSYTKSKAIELGLTGWVRNRRDGRVEVTAEGYESDLQQLLTWLHTGSPQADVSGVEVTWGSATGEFDEFDTLWTA